MRRTFALILLLGLMGCSSPPTAPATSSESSAPASAPGTGPAAQPTPPGPPPADLRSEPALKLELARASNVHTGAGPYFMLIRQLPVGSTVTYLGNREGWLRIRTPQGENGFVNSLDVSVTDARSGKVTYRWAQARWEMRTGGLEAVATRPGTGVIRLTVTGLPAAARVAELVPGAVAVLAGLEAERAALDIGDSGVGRVSIGPQGVLVDLEEGTLYHVTENQAGRLVMEFRPGLLALDKRADGWSLQLTGDTRPVLRAEGGQVVIDLPGSTVGPRFTAPPGATVTQVPPEPAPAQGQTQGTQGQGQNPGQGQSAFTTGPTRMPAGGLRLALPQPSWPYALYRPAPGRLELRSLPRGLAGKTIVVDPGHAGAESGAVGPAGTVEKDMNLAVALRLQPLLEATGARVVMVRTDDTPLLTAAEAARATSAQERIQVDLSNRVALANKNGVDLYLSIHGNGGPAGERGTEVFYASPNLNATLSRRLADLAQAELLAALGFPDRGVKQRPFHVIRYSDAPAVLVELGFMTHPSEERLLASPAGQQAAADALLKAIQKYFE